MFVELEVDRSGVCVEAYKPHEDKGLRSRLLDAKLKGGVKWRDVKIYVAWYEYGYGHRLPSTA